MSAEAELSFEGSDGAWIVQQLGPLPTAPLHSASNGNVLLVAWLDNGVVAGRWADGASNGGEFTIADAVPIDDLSGAVATESGFSIITETHRDFLPTRWRSADGRTWLAADGESFTVRASSISDLTPIDDGIIAVGALRASDTHPRRGPFFADAWLLDSAGEARRVPPESTGQSTIGQVEFVCGEIIAIGSDIEGPRTWRRSDDRWHNAANLEDSFDGGTAEIAQLVVGGDRILATGWFTPDKSFMSWSTPRPSHFVAVSENAGRSWTRTPRTELRISAPRTGSIGFAAGAFWWWMTIDERLELRRSADGVSWTTVDPSWTNEPELLAVLDLGETLAFVAASDDDLVLLTWQTE